MTVRIAFALVCLASAAGPAAAASLDDYLSRGYTVIDVTFVAGAFRGCRRGADLVFADGSEFTCRAASSQIDYRPRVTILAQDGAPPSVILIGGRAYGGGLVRLGTWRFAVPLPMADDPPGSPAQPDDALRPNAAIGSLESQQSKSLNTAQPDPLPPVGRRGDACRRRDESYIRKTPLPVVCASNSR